MLLYEDAKVCHLQAAIMMLHVNLLHFPRYATKQPQHLYFEL